MSMMQTIHLLDNVNIQTISSSAIAPVAVLSYCMQYSSLSSSLDEVSCQLD